MPPAASHPTRFLTVASRAARAAGALLAARAGRPRRVETKRNAIDLVTEVDRASERMIHRAVQAAFPAHGFQGEERTRTHPGAPYQWIVDPVDGTMNFVHGMPTFAVSIGLHHEGRPLAGVIYDPMRRELFSGLAGHGAWLNGVRIRVSRAPHLSTSLLSTGFPSAFRRTPRRYLKPFEAFQSCCHGVRRMGCTTLSLAYVACGRLEGFYEQHLWPWDIAAGMLLVQEAGGRLSDFRGRPAQLHRGELVASNGLIHHEMLSHLTTV